MLDIAVRFEEKDATVRFLPKKVGLEKILKQYDDTPFDVTLDGPIVTIARTKQLTLRGWTKRSKLGQPASKTEPSAKKVASAQKDKKLPQPIRLIVELVPAQGARLVQQPKLSLSNPPAAVLELASDFQKVELAETPSNDNKVETDDIGQKIRWVALLTEPVILNPGEIALPVGFLVKTVGIDEKQEAATGKLDVVLRSVAALPSTDLVVPGDVALVGGTLALSLGHLCDQSGCVEHFHKSLAKIGGLGAVRPHPNLEHPRATVYLRAQQAIDVWGLRERLRDRGVEIAGMVPHNLPSYRLRVELSRWQADKTSRDIAQCMDCRERTVNIVEKLAWVKKVKVAGGGISFQPAHPKVDLVELLGEITLGGTAPRAVWLVPTGVSMPKTAPPQLVGPSAGPKLSGSQIHPLVEFEFAHTSDVGTDILSLLGQQKWVSLTQFNSDPATVARLAIADRKYANLTPLLQELRATGRIPAQIRLREFGDIRIQIEFSHICGEVEYSKPPKRKKKPDKSKAKPDESKSTPEESNARPDKPKAKPDKSKPKPDKSKAKPKKPFVSKPLRPSSTSNGRRAVEAAVASIGWIKDAVFHDYHTKPAFNGPRKLTISLQAGGDDVVRLEQLISALRDAGFPPKSVIVSRRFPGIPFAKPLPGDLQLMDRQGQQLLLASLKKPDRPLALVFVSLKMSKEEEVQRRSQILSFLKRDDRQVSRSHRFLGGKREPGRRVHRRCEILG